MKSINFLFVFLIALCVFTGNLYAQTQTYVNGYYRSDGTYVNGYYRSSTNNNSSQSYSLPSSTFSFPSSYDSPSYSTPSSTRTYSNGGQIYLQNGYFRSNGTYVEPHLKTKPDNYQWNNLNSIFDPEY